MAHTKAAKARKSPRDPGGDKRLTGGNAEAAKFLGLSREQFNDPGFCLLCGESKCDCGDY